MSGFPCSKIGDRTSDQFSYGKAEVLMTQSFVFKIPDNFDLSTITAGCLRTAFILRLPFRIRTGRLFRLPVDSAFEVVFRNKLDIPTGTTSDEIRALMWIGERFRPREEFFTEALVIDRKPKVNDQTAKQLAEWATKETADTMPDCGMRYFEAHQSLNDAIVAYHSGTQALFGGYIVERLSTNEFFDLLRYVHITITPPGHILSDDNILELLDARAGRDFAKVGGQFWPDLADVAADQLASINRHIELHKKSYILSIFS